jgi:ABC-type oligopeptide transport system substrate-binding subunit
MLSFSIFKESDLSSTEDKINSKFTPSGPYKIQSFSETGVLLEPNEQYWDKSLLAKIPKHIQLTPETKTKEFDALLAGEVDVAHSASSAIDKTILAKSGIQIVPAGDIQYYITPDFKGPTLSKFPQLVKIINVLLDREELVRVMSTNGLNGMTPITGITANIDLIEKQEKEAFVAEQKTRKTTQEKLKKITEAMTAAGIRLKFARGTQTKFSVAVSDAVADQLRSFGVPLEVEGITSAFAYRNKRNGEFDIYMGGEMFDTIQPLRALKFVLNTDPQHTNLPATHPVFEITSRKPTKYEDHIKALQEFNNLNRKDGFVVPLVSDQMLILFSKKIDTSRVPNDFVWHPQDVSLKAPTHDKR